MLLIEKGLTVVNADFLVLTTVIGEVINMKQGIYLVVETPRAGKLGHRFISSSNAPSEKSIVDIFTKSVTNPVGANYISVSMSVVQTLPGSVRQGNEMIVLIGLDTEKVNIVKIKDFLGKLFAKLDLLVEETDWEKESNKIICFNPILGDWISGEHFQDLPAFIEKPIFSLLQRLLFWISSQRLWFLFAFVLLLVPVLFALLTRSPGGGETSNKPPIEKPITPKYEKNLGNEFKCNAEILKSEMKDFIIGINQKFDDKKMNEYSKFFFDDNLNPNPKKYALILEQSEKFKYFYKKTLLIDGFDYLKLRRKIFECAEKLCEISSKIEKNDGLKNELEKYIKNEGFVAIYFENSEINKLKLKNPETPLFSKQDEKCLNALHFFLDPEGKYKNINIAFFSFRKNQTDLFNFFDLVILLGKNKDSGKKLITDKIESLKRGNADFKDAMIKVLEETIVFIDNLCELDPSFNYTMKKSVN